MSDQGSPRQAVHWSGLQAFHSLWDPWLLPVAATPILGVALVLEHRPLLRLSCLVASAVLLAFTTAAVARDRLRDATVEMALESLIATAAIAFLAWGLGFPGELASNLDRASAIAGVVAIVIAIAALAAVGWLASIDRESRRPALGLLAGALAAVVVTGFAALRALFDKPLPHWISDLAILATIVCICCAIVHPSRRSLRLPANRLQHGHVARRAALTVGAVLVGPLLLVVPLTADSLSLPIVATLSVVLTLLAAAHIYRLLRRWGALEHEIHHDSLTGLPNRQYFNVRLHSAIERARRDDEELAVLFLDLDHFKDVNDTLGHAAGNALLMQVASRLRAKMPLDHTVARLGGDEFAVLVPTLPALAVEASEDMQRPPDAIDLIVQTTLDAFAEPFDLSHKMVSVTPSVGAARFPFDGTDASALLERADSEMYQAKSRRRAARRASAAVVSVEPSRDIELALRRAIHEDRLLLHYQPKVDLEHGRVVAVEALLRWRHASGGLMLPASFLPIAEDNAMMPALAEWVLLEACAQNQRWLEAGAPPVRVSVNVSPSQLRSRRLTELVERVLRFTSMPADLLELEINAESLELDTHILVEEVSALRSLGVRCVIDDIGRAGRIEDLANLEVDAIEIDRRHVQAIELDGGRVVAATLAMAVALGIETVAEGITTTEQLTFVRERGCRVGQGALLAHPAVADEIEHVLHLSFGEDGLLAGHDEGLSTVSNELMRKTGA